MYRRGGCNNGEIAMNRNYDVKILQIYSNHTTKLRFKIVSKDYSFTSYSFQLDWNKIEAQMIFIKDQSSGVSTYEGGIVTIITGISRGGVPAYGLSLPGKKVLNGLGPAQEEMHSQFEHLFGKATALGSRVSLCV